MPVSLANVRSELLPGLFDVRGSYDMISRITLAALAVATMAFSAPAEAGYRHHHRHYAHHHRMLDANGNGARRHHTSRRGGACDGFQRCRCGTTAARHFGLPYAYKGFNLKMASEWGRAFPRTSFHVGVAGVKPHHVLTVVGGSSCSTATIYDDAGTRQRNVCGFMFVEVGSGFTREGSAQTHRHHRVRYARR